MKVEVTDPFGVADDAQMPSLAAALDPLRAGKELKRRLPRLSKDGRLRLAAIRVTRYKPARRCVIEYDVQLLQPDMEPRLVTLIGKVRARRFGNESYRLLDEIWQKGFSEVSEDGISVPEPVGVISSLHMWFQRKVPGETATSLLASPEGLRLSRQVAEAAHKLHSANVTTQKRHNISDELRILHECFGKLRTVKPNWTDRVNRLESACDRLAGTLPDTLPTGIHRDFYPAQVIVAPDRLYLIDFDLYCLGDPALDIGNFLGHMTEQAVRETGAADAFADSEHALEDRFVELSGEARRPAIRVYAALTIARLLYLSTQLPGREAATEALFTLCEDRVCAR